MRPTQILRSSGGGGPPNWKVGNWLGDWGNFAREIAEGLQQLTSTISRNLEMDDELGRSSMRWCDCERNFLSMEEDNCGRNLRDHIDKARKLTPAIGGTKQKGIIHWGVSANRQNVLAGVGHDAVFNTFRRTKAQIGYWVPPMLLGYYLLSWATEKNEYLNSKAGRAEFAEEE
ncbi:ubiquinol-cytochrome-C oxidoreductase complex III subunit VIII [Paramyrothecium foliicola]|nr:ubiquinol-cytochrome-C oxidoreductase complex III subunit VIII [Paramyrothecium foliicola]